MYKTVRPPPVAAHRDFTHSPSAKFSCSICREERHEVGPPAPAPLLGPPLVAPPPCRGQTAHPPRLAGWQRPPPDAATGRSAPQSGRRRGQHRLGPPGRQHPEVSPAEEPGASAPAPTGTGGHRGRGGGGEDGRAAAETQRGAAAVHRPDLPPAEEYDPDGQDGEPEGAGAAQPQSARRGREVKIYFLFLINASLKQPSSCVSIKTSLTLVVVVRLPSSSPHRFTHRWCQFTHHSIRE